MERDVGGEISGGDDDDSGESDEDSLDIVDVELFEEVVQDKKVRETMRGRVSILTRMDFSKGDVEGREMKKARSFKGKEMKKVHSVKRQKFDLRRVQSQKLEVVKQDLAGIVTSENIVRILSRGGSISDTITAILTMPLWIEPVEFFILFKISFAKDLKNHKKLKNTMKKKL